ncbi:signal recognition particle protein [Mycoplasmopsis cricetuli]|uniref:signal recognition particle protein n=1 Tax=Mycoplasmopsis cricetuli TaxID=171283 RepID=UPI00046E59E6|nr:signal recognition particle protein [Mycoplasmopsis cricetuli]
MTNFLEKRLQKSIAKMSKKIQLREEDILEVIREVKFSLLEADVNLKVVKEFIGNVKQKALEEGQVIGKLNPSQTMVKIFHEELVNILGGSVKEIKISKKPYIIMMCGLQGSGKTTATAKLAYFLRKKKYIEKPLVVAADIYRPAAVEQLITLAKSINVDYFEKGINNPVNEIVTQAINFAKENQNDLIIIDTAGRLSIDEKLMNELVSLKHNINPNEILFVADALSGQDIINVASIFNDNLKLTGSIITKLDSDARGGAALSLSQVLNLPIKFIGTGEKVSNLDLFYPDRMADRILGMGDVLTLIEKAQDNLDHNKVSNMMERMFKEDFNLNDLMDQITEIKKLGKFSKILKMLPGQFANKVKEQDLENAEHKLEMYSILMSSMTLQEKNNPKLLKNASRKNRILKGSGRSAQEYNKLLSDFDNMAKRLGEMKKKFKNGGGISGIGGLF